MQKALFGLELRFIVSPYIFNMTITTSLTLAQKRLIGHEIQRRRAKGESTRQDTIAQWAQQTFRLRNPPSQPTISRIINHPPSIPLHHEPFVNKRHRAGKHQIIEQALAQWVQTQYIARRCIIGQMIRDKGLRLQTLANNNLPEG